MVGEEERQTHCRAARRETETDNQGALVTIDEEEKAAALLKTKVWLHPRGYATASGQGAVLISEQIKGAYTVAQAQCIIELLACAIAEATEAVEQREHEDNQDEDHSPHPVTLRDVGVTP